MELADSKECGHTANVLAEKALEVQAKGVEGEGIELQYLVVLWNIAGHLARISQALGRDPEPPKDPTVPF